MQEPYKLIKNFLEESEVKYEEIEHEPVYTSEQAAQVRGLSQKQGAKSLLLKVDKKFIITVMSGDQKLDTKKLKTLLRAKKVRFATPEEVVCLMGCEIGSCYPFGNLVGLDMLVDQSLSKNKIIAFNPGVHGKTIKIQWKDYFTTIKPKLVQIT